MKINIKGFKYKSNYYFKWIKLLGYMIKACGFSTVPDKVKDL